MFKSLFSFGLFLCSFLCPLAAKANPLSQTSPPEISLDCQLLEYDLYHFSRSGDFAPLTSRSAPHLVTLFTFLLPSQQILFGEPPAVAPFLPTCQERIKPSLFLQRAQQGVYGRYRSHSIPYTPKNTISFSRRASIALSFSSAPQTNSFSSPLRGQQIARFAQKQFPVVVKVVVA